MLLGHVLCEWCLFWVGGMGGALFCVGGGRWVIVLSGWGLVRKYFEWVVLGLSGGGYSV